MNTDAIDQLPPVPATPVSAAPFNAGAFAFRELSKGMNYEGHPNSTWATDPTLATIFLCTLAITRTHRSSQIPPDLANLARQVLDLVATKRDELRRVMPNQGVEASTRVDLTLFNTLQSCEPQTL